MPIQHSFSILLCNLKLVAKLAVITAIGFILACLTLYGIIRPFYDGLMQMVESSSFLINPDSFINHPFRTFSEIVREYGRFLGSMGWKKGLFSIAACFVGFKFFMTFPLLPASKVIYSKMTTGFNIGIINAFIATGFQNLLLALTATLFLSVLDLSACVGLIALTVVLTKKIRIVGLSVTILVGLLYISARMAIFCQWIPEICASEKVNPFSVLFSSLRLGFVHFRKNFLCMFFINFLFLAFVASTALPSFGVVPLLLIPFYYVLYVALTLTLNAAYRKRKYYTDNGTNIYNPTRLF